ncbi:MAG TPA: TetR/AcrR family transcriptional regulator [Chromatiales bacterium]|nr:TetR/AcrR family transcriptional regulator [Thiotrichales bacterium]HIP69135.1 TetR/AcrR family transcriptional regulator [Chromatiales bacterium]
MHLTETKPEIKHSKRFWHWWQCQRCATGKVQAREQILQAAFDEIHHVGFQAASLSRILAHTGLTKGALYHHFGSKLALGYAVVDELLLEYLREIWLRPLEKTDDPIKQLISSLHKMGENIRQEDLELGCPLNNLAQEMAPIDEGFRRRLEAAYSEWRGGIESALLRGQKSGFVRHDVDAKSTAATLVATMEGCIGMAKNAQSRELLLQCGRGIIQYLESLKKHTRKRKVT